MTTEHSTAARFARTWGPHTPSPPPPHAAGALLAAWLLLAAQTAAGGASDIPRMADGTPDFSGFWQTLSDADYGLEPHAGRADAAPSIGVVEGGELPYQPWARAQRDRNFAARATADRSRLSCYTLGVPRSVYFPAPFQILQRARDLTLVAPFGAVRTIHTNGTLHPKGPFNFWLGDSRAHFEGDTLVVDVVDFNTETWLDRAGNFHSEAMHVVERWTFLDANTIEYEATIEDPEVYTRPFSLSVMLHRRREPGFKLIENYCFTREYDPFYPFPQTTHAAPQDAIAVSDADAGER